MKLSRNTLKKLASANGCPAVIPPDSIFNLPERILQFGTGVLLRALPDYFVDKANRSGIFNGRIVVVKSTDRGGTESFHEQDNLYTIAVRGVENGREIKENITCSAISRVLSAKQDWKEVLACAANPELSIVISNTTEIGICFSEDNIKLSPPATFPGKLLALLHERYRIFSGKPECGMVIVPTELIINNGDKLKAAVLSLAESNQLSPDFIDWVCKHNRFCNSLVDRIVPGKPDQESKKRLEDEMGYTDDLITLSEEYRLWAIEGDDYVKSVLSFAEVDEGVVIDGNIEKFRELKLRLLNAPHTLSCGLAFLSGFESVIAAMRDPCMTRFVRELILEDIAPLITGDISLNEALDFGRKVIDRFSNPAIEHLWINITAQYTSKVKMRYLPLIVKSFEKNDCVPKKMAVGFASYLLFMKPVQITDGKYYGINEGNQYLINDESASILAAKWANCSSSLSLVQSVLQDAALWEQDLSKLSGFAEQAAGILDRLRNSDPKELINESLL